LLLGPLIFREPLCFWRARAPNLAAVPFDFDAAFRNKPVILAPMEDVTDAVFRKVCRDRGADLCVTEFVNVEGLLRGARDAAHKIELLPDDQPTAIQIYGADAERLAEAAEVALRSGPAYIDINCGCWVPKIARRGAGAGWLRDPLAMVAMAKMVAARVAPMPLTVKTRIGYGPESEMPIIDLARRLEDVGVRAITIHCRTAQMGHSGAADWTWAQKAREVVSVPVIVNGDVKSGEDALASLASTGVAGTMVGRHAIDHPWVFREARSLIDHGVTTAPPTPLERIQLCRDHLRLQAEERGDLRAIRSLRRHWPGYLRGLHNGAALRRELNVTDDLPATYALFDRFEGELSSVEHAA
jgi:tRNA-dihydrouridine synthase B